MNLGFWKNKEVLITGGAGFIGSNLAARLVNFGCKVTIIDNLWRGKEQYIEAIQDRITFVKGDLTDLQMCRSTCKNKDIIFHLASRVGGIGYYLEKPGEVILQNTLMDANVIQSILEQNIPKLFYASSAHVYPIELQLTPDSPAIKESDFVPAHPELAYGWAKLHAEHLIKNLIQEGRPFHASVARLIGVYGKHQDIELATGSAIPVFCRKAIEYPKIPFKIWGSGKETRSFCYIEDILDAMVLSVEKLEETKLLGPYNLGAEGCISIEDLAQTIIKISGKEILLEKDPSKDTVIWGQRVDCTLVNDLLDGWKPKWSLEAGLTEVYKYIEQRLNA
jgi:GDP-D-mannose 3',5'-epimerase